MTGALLLAAALSYAHPEQLVDSEWVAAHHADPHVRVVDMRRSGYDAGHLPSAVWLDPEAVREPDQDPTYLLSPARMTALMTSLGIDDATRVVAYDDRGGLFASRLWWLLETYGHHEVALLNGGSVAWLQEGRALTTAVPTVRSVAGFTTTLRPQWVATAAEVVGAIGRPGTVIVDARTTGEMDGSDQRNSRRPGIVPGAVPLYWEDVLDPVRKTLLPPDALAAVIARHGLRATDTVIAYCQVGHRSSVDLFALWQIGFQSLRNYYGSWEEWARRPDLPAVLP